MKTLLKINSIINIILMISACSPLFLFSAIGIGVWQYGGNILILLIQWAVPNKVLLFKTRGWYTLLSTSVLALTFLLEDYTDIVWVIIGIGSFICAIWYTIICQSELTNIKTKQASLETNIQNQ